MKFNLILVLTLFSASTALSQLVSAPKERKAIVVNIPTNIERYGIDYKLVDESLLEDGLEILNSLNLEAIEHLRSENEDVIVTEPDTSFEIILFHSKRKKQKDNPIHHNLD